MKPLRDSDQVDCPCCGRFIEIVADHWLYADDHPQPADLGQDV
jgi:hypothetical protein